MSGPVLFFFFFFFFRYRRSTTIRCSTNIGKIIFAPFSPRRIIADLCLYRVLGCSKMRAAFSTINDNPHLGFHYIYYTWSRFIILVCIYFLRYTHTSCILYIYFIHIYHCIYFLLFLFILLFLFNQKCILTLLITARLFFTSTKHAVH